MAQFCSSNLFNSSSSDCFTQRGDFFTTWQPLFTSLFFSYSVFFSCLYEDDDVTSSVHDVNH